MNANLDIESRNGEDATLSIGDVVAATGVGEATLRAWERRFGFPTPRREPSGHFDQIRNPVLVQDAGRDGRAVSARTMDGDASVAWDFS